MTVRGWCPSLAEPMRSGDGWIVRIKPRRRGLSAAQARGLAAAVRRWGSGWMGATNRGNIQVRGLGDGEVEAFAEAALATGLADRDPGVERRRNLVVPPLLGADPALERRFEGLIDELEAVLRDGAFAALPGKFGIVLDGSGSLPIGPVPGDLRLLGAAEEVWVWPDGARGAVRCAWSDAAGVAARMIRLFLHRRGEARRMRGLLTALGEEGFWATLGEGAEALPDPLPSVEAIGFRDFCADLPGLGFVGVGLPLGRLEAGLLEVLATQAEAHGDGTLRVTPWRSLLLPGIGRAHARAVVARLDAAGAITAPEDPRLRVVACPGTPACESGFVATMVDAGRFLSLGALPARGLLHVSGCGKGCAHPGAAEAVLVGGADGRYGLVRRGTAGDAPEATGLSVEEAAARLRAAEHGTR